MEESRGRHLAEQLRANLDALRARGIDPFKATRYDVTAHAAELHQRYGELGADAPAGDVPYALAGRLMSVRKMGKGAIWADLWDRSGRMQLYAREDALGPEEFAVFDLLDRGDLIGVTGTVFRSKKGDLTLRVARFPSSAKS